MNCYGFTGGNGTASRVVQLGQDEFTVAVFIQANFGDCHELTVGGAPMGDLDVQCPLNDDA